MYASSLSELCDEVMWSLDANDQQGFMAALDRIARATPHARPADVQEAAGKLARVLAIIPPWKGTDLVQVAGRVASYCTDPTGLLAVLDRRTTGLLELAAWFATTLDGKDLPDPEDPTLFQEAAARARDVLAQPGRVMLPTILDLPARPEAQASSLAEAWFSCGAWVQPLMHLAQRQDVRAILPGRDRLIAATDAAREHIAPADWLYGLLHVLDNEVLVILHRPTGLGYRVTISGVGDNFQLHTLLAASLIGKKSRGFIPGKAPSPAEILAASDGPNVTPQGGIRAYFSLVDAYGTRIWNESRPSDIPRLEGTRVVVLDPPMYRQAWTAGRAYPRMRPTVEITEFLNPHAASYWLSKVRPPTR